MKGVNVNVIYVLWTVTWMLCYIPSFVHYELLQVFLDVLVITCSIFGHVTHLTSQFIYCILYTSFLVHMDKYLKVFIHVHTKWSVQNVMHICTLTISSSGGEFSEETQKIKTNWGGKQQTKNFCMILFIIKSRNQSMALLTTPCKFAKLSKLIGK